MITDVLYFYLTPDIQVFCLKHKRKPLFSFGELNVLSVLNLLRLYVDNQKKYLATKYCMITMLEI